MVTKIVTISDTHGRHGLIKNIPEGDIIICSGDITTMGHKSEVIDFLDWFNSLTQFKHKIFIAGNHDFYFDTEYKAYTTRGSIRHKRTNTKEEELIELLSNYPNLIYLNDSGVEINEIKIWGSPVQPWFHDWAFNKQRGEDIKKHWDLIPNNTEILITHGPPYLHGDKTIRGYDNVGCEDLLEAILKNENIKVNIFGHIHEGYGITEEADKIFINTSILDIYYDVRNKPVCFEWDSETKKATILK